VWLYFCLMLFRFVCFGGGGVGVFGCGGGGGGGAFVGLNWRKHPQTLKCIALLQVLCSTMPLFAVIVTISAGHGGPITLLALV